MYTRRFAPSPGGNCNYGTCLYTAPDMCSRGKRARPTFHLREQPLHNGEGLSLALVLAGDIRDSRCFVRCLVAFAEVRGRNRYTGIRAGAISAKIARSLSQPEYIRERCPKPFSGIIRYPLAGLCVSLFRVLQKSFPAVVFCWTGTWLCPDAR